MQFCRVTFSMFYAHTSFPQDEETTFSSPVCELVFVLIFVPTIHTSKVQFQTCYKSHNNVCIWFPLFVPPYHRNKVIFSSKGCSCLGMLEVVIAHLFLRLTWLRYCVIANKQDYECKNLSLLLAHYHLPPTGLAAPI